MTVEEAVKYINNHTWSSSRLGLDRTRTLLSLLGNPEKELKFIHIAGTNGKGSTAAMTAAVLKAQGFKTGLYISPYVAEFNERISVDSEPIPDEALARITGQVAAASELMPDHPSQFEMITAIGMLYFLGQNCDVVVLEVGMGGRLDSTNVIGPPLAAVITNIGLDHTEYLGGTLEEIAAEKAGIIKEGTDTVTYANVPTVLAVLREICAERGARLYEAESVEPLFHSLKGQGFKYHGKEYELSLLGENQLKNAAVCLKTVEVLNNKGWKIGDDAVREGLKCVRWPARFEVISRDPLFILDGGHNPQCAESLAENIKAYLPGEKVTFVLGMLKDKDIEGVLDIIMPFAARVITLTPPSPRALSAEQLKELIMTRTEPDKVSAAGTADEALKLARSFPEPIVAFGSLYMAGDILRYLRG